MHVLKTLTALLIFTLSTIAHAADWDMRSRRAILVFSLSGVGFDQLSAIDPEFVKQNGVAPITPPHLSQTYPGQATLATGAPPEEHGILGNLLAPEEIAREITDRNDPRRLLVKPIWTEAAERGKSVFVDSWLFSSGPWHGVDHHATRTYESVTATKHKEQIATDALDRLATWKGQSDLLFLGYNDELDATAHATGSESRLTRTKWAEQRALFDRLQASVDEARKEGRDVRVLFVSDHGMDTENCEDCRVVDVAAFLAKHDFKESDFAIDHFGAKITFRNRAIEGAQLVKEFLSANGIQSKNDGESVRIHSFLEARFGESKDWTPTTKSSREFVYHYPKKFRGDHGMDPDEFPSMRGVIWTYPPLPPGVELPAATAGVKSFVFTLFGDVPSATGGAMPCDPGTRTVLNPPEAIAGRGVIQLGDFVRSLAD